MIFVLLPSSRKVILIVLFPNGYTRSHVEKCESMSLFVWKRLKQKGHRVTDKFVPKPFNLCMFSFLKSCCYSCFFFSIFFSLSFFFSYIIYRKIFAILDKDRKKWILIFYFLIVTKLCFSLLVTSWPSIIIDRKTWSTKIFFSAHTRATTNDRARLVELLMSYVIFGFHLCHVKMFRMCQRSTSIYARICAHFEKSSSRLSCVGVIRVKRQDGCLLIAAARVTRVVERVNKLSDAFSRDTRVRGSCIHRAHTPPCIKN